MAIHWQIPFISLRTHTHYTVNVYDANYAGSPVVLRGAVDPFTTEENGDDDPFAPIRTQSGKLRIVDNGFAADGVTTFNRKDFVPAVASDRPVTLTHQSGSTTVVDWQGFIQTQDFSGTLYGNPQVREFPIYCAVSLLKSQQPSTEDIQKHNFAWLLNYAADLASSLSGGAVGFDDFFVQGNQDAQQWLLKQFEWMNFLEENDSDDEGDVTPKYNIYEVMEDSFKFWGWTCRTQGRTLYLTCYDDLTEQKWVRITKAQMIKMAGGTTAGTTNLAFVATTLSGNVFASTENDDFKRRGPSKATVKGDCNDQDTLFEFAPPSVEKLMDDTGYTWVDGEEAGTGYFTTTPIRSFNTLAMKGDATQRGGFCRRQVYSDAESDNATEMDMFTIDNTNYDRDTPIISLQSKKAINYTGGSLKIKGDVYVGAKRWDYNWANDLLWVRVGIGLTKATAKWFYVMGDDPQGHITHRWQTTPFAFGSWVHNGGFTGVNVILAQCNYIPCDEYLYGYLFIDINGMNMFYEHEETSFEIGNFEVDFTRDRTFFPTSTSDVRSRTMAEKRVSSREYTASNINGTGDKWNADCIFASDNNMMYGYGLIINPSDGSFMDKTRYNHDQGTDRMEYPEQHLADRVAAFWARSKRQVTMQLRADAIADITPRHKVKLGTELTEYNPTVISREWCDDTVNITLLETRTS